MHDSWVSLKLPQGLKEYADSRARELGITRSQLVRLLLQADKQRAERILQSK